MPSQTTATRLQCRHIHTDGRRCGSPCVRTQDFCFYHGRARRPGPRQPQVKTLTDRKNSTFELPSPADLAERAGVQLALGQILHKIAHNEIDPRRAGLLLYGLQIASMNLPREQAAKPTAIDADDLVDEVAEHHIAGPLAPVADWEDNRPKSSIELLWEKYERDHGLSADQAADRAAIATEPTRSAISLNASVAPAARCRSTRSLSGVRPMNRQQRRAQATAGRPVAHAACTRPSIRPLF